MPNNDDSSAARPTTRALPEPDAYGQAALLLAESILFALTEAGVLTKQQAIEAVRTAHSVKIDLAERISESDSNLRRSLTLLSAIERSLAAVDMRLP